MSSPGQTPRRGKRLRLRLRIMISRAVTEVGISTFSVGRYFWKQRGVLCYMSKNLQNLAFLLKILQKLGTIKFSVAALMISIGSVWTLLKSLEKLRRRHLRILLGLRKISSPTSEGSGWRAVTSLR